MNHDARSYAYAPDLNSLLPPLGVLWEALGDEPGWCLRSANVTREAIGLSDPSQCSSAQPVTVTGTTLSLETM